MRISEAQAEQARRAQFYRTGEVTGPGTLVCDSCGESLRFHATGYIPGCPACGHTVYHRKTVSEELGRDD